MKNYTIRLRCNNCGGGDNVPVNKLYDYAKKSFGVYLCPYGCGEKTEMVLCSIDDDEIFDTQDQLEKSERRLKELQNLPEWQKKGFDKREAEISYISRAIKVLELRLQKNYD